MPARLLFRAFGDVNLGRAVGQELLKGNVDYPFEHVRDFLHEADLVFVNLESQLTDQGGETQHPKDHFVFCGPPSGASSLKRANILVVSTANNHAYDYGKRALRETITSLGREGITVVGTTHDSLSLSPPVVVVKNGIRLGFVAYTEFVNSNGKWQGWISTFDRKRAKREIDSLRKVADVVVASYHGGKEYDDEPQKFTLAQLRFLSDAGAHIVLGHHPHVPQGVEVRDDKLIFYSLGNFVFYQPQRYWTQIGLAVDILFEKRDNAVSIHSTRLIPVRAGKQPTFTVNTPERTLLFERLQRLSNVTIDQQDNFFLLQSSLRE
ncbi:MAG: CapA family protein [Bacteroidota bacterium]